MLHTLKREKKESSKNPNQETEARTSGEKKDAGPSPRGGLQAEEHCKNFHQEYDTLKQPGRDKQGKRKNQPEPKKRGRSMALRSWKGQISISLKEEYEDKIDRHKEKFREKSPTEELYNRIDEIIENAPTPEERAERLREEAEQKMEEAEKWEKRAGKKKARTELKEKKEELESVKKKLQQITEEGQKTEDEFKEEARSEIREEKKNKLETSPTDKSIEDPEIQDRIDRKVESRVEAWKEDKNNKDKLKEKKQSLEEDIQECQDFLEE